jgi:hypothetical protein
MDAPADLMTLMANSNPETGAALYAYKHRESIIIGGLVVLVLFFIVMSFTFGHFHYNKMKTASQVMLGGVLVALGAYMYHIS